MVKKFFILVVLLAFALSFVSASCVVTLDKTSYVAGETATAAMSCSTNPEKNTDYTLTWSYQNGTIVETDSGTTPNTVNQLFYQSYTIPSSWPNGIYLNASMNGTGLTITQNDSANVTGVGGGGSATLEITNTTFGGGYLGLVSSVKATITDETGKKISGGLCDISALSNDESQVLLEAYSTIVGGMIGLSDVLPPTRFKEGTDYAYEIECFCGSLGSSTECIDEDGNSINNSVGSAKNFFTTKTYLTLNTVVNGETFNMKDFITICVNVTNIDYPERIPIEIDYQARCSVGTDNNNDLDRILIFSDGQSYDKRGISASTTQMQCKKFIVPEVREYEGNNNTCYASSNVWVIGENGERILGYPTTSPLFYINSTELNLKVDWAQTSNLTFNSIINLSADSFSSWNGSNYGNIDIQLISSDEINDPDLRQIINGVDLNNFLISKYIKSVTVTNLTGDIVPSYLEFNDDGNLEIELRNQNLNQSGWYNLTVVFNDYEERTAVALEGIENKTGTFHLAVDCPSYAAAGSDITCQISARVEDSQIVQKEVDFTCYLYDGISNYNSLNFNQMINHTLFTTNKTISVPSTFTGTQNYIFQCEAGYYNLGSRIDYFYDSFVTYTSSGSSGSSSTRGNPITGDASLEVPDDEDKNGNGIPDSEEEGPGIFSGSAFSKILKILSVIAVLVLIFIIVSGLKSRSESKNKFAKIFLTALIIVGIIALLIYLFNKIPSDLPKKIIQDSLFRGIILTIFIALVIAFLFRVLNIRGEIKFGRDKIFDRYDKKMKEQEKINKEILKHELQHQKNLRNYKIVKIKK